MKNGSKDNFFDRHYKKYDRWYDKNKFAYFSELEAIKKVLPKDGHGLEVGVGSGRFAGPLKIDIGVDSSPEMVKLAKGRGVNAVLRPGENLLFKRSEFDYVAIIFTLCFAKDPQKVIKETSRVLKAHGKIVVGIVDKNSFLGKHYQRKESIFYNEATFFTVEEVVDMLKSYGFTGFTYVQTLFDYPENMKCVEESLEGHGKGGFIVIGAVKEENT